MTHAKLVALFLSTFVTFNAATVWAEDNNAEVAADDNSIHVAMRKNPGCNCCDLWADHLREHGFSVTSREDPRILLFKLERSIPDPLMSCHTAVIDGYFIEGHVPAQDILRLLKDRPKHVTGLAVPAMPLGSPGMEHPRPQAFRTIALLSDGSAYVYAEHEAGKDYSAAAAE